MPLVGEKGECEMGRNRKTMLEDLEAMVEARLDGYIQDAGELLHGMHEEHPDAIDALAVLMLAGCALAQIVGMDEDRYVEGIRGAWSSVGVEVEEARVQ